MKLKSFICGLLLTSLLSSTAAFAEGDKKLELLTPGELRIATEGTAPPYSMRGPGGQISGLEIAVMTEVAKRLHLKLVPVVTKWDSILIGLQANKFDMSMAAIDITPERQKSVVFADAWIESGGRILAPKDTSIKTPDDLKGKKIGAQVSSTYARLAEEHGAQLKNYSDITSAVQDMINGNLDGVINDSIGNAYLIEHNHLPFVQVPGYLSQVQKGFTFAKGKPNLVAAVNKALADMKSDGTFARLTTAIVGLDPAPKNPVLTLPQ